MAFTYGHVHIPLPSDRRTEAVFGWFGEYLALNEEGRHLRLYRSPGVENGHSEPDFIEVGEFGPQPCQAVAFPQRLVQPRTKEIAMLTDEGDVRRYALTYNNAPHLIENMRVDDGLCLAYSQPMNMLAVGCRGGAVTIFATTEHGGSTRMVRQLSNSDVLSLAFTEKGILIARDAGTRAYSLTGVTLNQGRFNARAANVELLKHADGGLLSDLEVYTMEAQPCGHQVLFAGVGRRAYLVKMDSDAVQEADDDTPRSRLRVASVQVIHTQLGGGYIRYAHFLSNNRFVLGDRNSLEVYVQSTDGSCVRVDGYDFGGDHTLIACRAHANHRLYLLTAPFPQPAGVEVLE